MDKIFTIFDFDGVLYDGILLEDNYLDKSKLRNLDLLVKIASPVTGDGTRHVLGTILTKKTHEEVNVAYLFKDAGFAFSGGIRGLRNDFYEFRASDSEIEVNIIYNLAKRSRGKFVEVWSDDVDVLDACKNMKIFTRKFKDCVEIK